MEIIHPDDRIRVEAEWKPGQTAVADYEIELRYRMANEKYRWHLVRATPMHDVEGQVIGWSGISVDIQDRKSVHASLAAETRSIDAEREKLATDLRMQSRVLKSVIAGKSLEEIMLTLVKSAQQTRPEMICSVLRLDPRQNRLYNLAATRLPDFYLAAIDGLEIGPDVGSCGTTAFHGTRTIAEDIATDPRWAKYRHLASQAKLRACWSEPILSSRGDVFGTFAIYYLQPQHPDSSDLQFIASCASVASLAMERFQLDQALREEKRSLATLISNLPGAVYRCRNDRAWSMDFVSEGICELTGYSADEIRTGVVELGTDLIHPDDQQMVWDHVQRGIEQRAPFHIVYRIRHRDGSIRWAREQGRGVFSEQGDLEALEGFITDITESRRTRQRLLQAERLAAIGQMTSAIAHESRNALQRVQSGVDILRLDLTDDQAKRDLGRIEDAKNSLWRLLEEVRSYAAPINLSRTPTELTSVWRQAWKHLEPLRQGRDAALREVVEGISLTCILDGFQMEQVFRNLMENSLAACADPVRIEIRCADLDMRGIPSLQIRVRDNGSGLTEEVQRQLFEAFFTTKPKGTGLGMAIAKRIVEAHGGTLQIDSTVEQGAGFLITIPRIIT